MSTLKVNNLQVGQDSTATNNLTWFQPGSPDGTIRLGSGNAGSATTKFTFDKDGNLTCVGDITANSIIAPIEGTLDDWIIHAGDTNTKFGFSANDTFAVETAGSERFIITSTGKVGIAHHNESQIAKELTIRPANDGGVRLVRPGETSGTPNTHLDITTTTSGNAYPSGEAYTVKYKTMNCDALFETYSSGGTGGNFSFRTGAGSGNQVERLRIASNGLIYVNRDGVGGRIDATAGDGSMIFSDGNGRQTFKITTMASGQSAAHAFDATGQLGIGTASPAMKLEVINKDTGTGETNKRIAGFFKESATTASDKEGYIHIGTMTGHYGVKLGYTNEGNSPGYLNQGFFISTVYNNQGLTNHVKRFNITSAGKVLVGDGNTITQARSFEVRGTGNQGILVGSTNNNGAQLLLDGIGGGDGSGGDYGALEVPTSGHLTIRNHDADKNIIFGVGSASGGNDSVILRSNGNFGIGNRTGSPNSLLHVHTGSGDCNTRIEGASHARLRITSHSGASIIEFGDTSNDAIGKIQYNHTDGSSNIDSLQLRTGGSDRMLMQGNVIGIMGPNINDYTGWHTNSDAVIAFREKGNIISRSEHLLFSQNFRYDSSDVGKFQENGYGTMYTQAAGSVGQHEFYITTTNNTSGQGAAASMTPKMKIGNTVDIGANYVKHSGSGQTCKTFAGSLTLADGQVGNIMYNGSGYTRGFFEIWIISYHGSIGRAHWTGEQSRYSGNDNYVNSNSMGYTTLDRYQDGVNNNGIRITRTGTYGNVTYNFFARAISANATSNWSSSYNKYTEGAF